MRARRARLHINSKHYLEVVIWPTLSSMRNRYREIKGAGGVRRLYAFYEYALTYTVSRSGTRPSPRQRRIGAVNFAMGNIGVGTVAHELQHAVDAYAKWRGWDVYRDYDLFCEETAEVAEALHLQFWQWFEKTFPD